MSYGRWYRTAPAITYCPVCQTPPLHAVGVVLAKPHERCWKALRTGDWSLTEPNELKRSDNE